jgi:hypothetical protein
MRFDGAPGHFELRSDFTIVTALQQQLGYLLFPRTQTDGFFLHVDSFPKG